MFCQIGSNRIISRIFGLKKTKIFETTLLSTPISPNMVLFLEIQKLSSCCNGANCSTTIPSTLSTSSLQVAVAKQKTKVKYLGKAVKHHDGNLLLSRITPLQCCLKMGQSFLMKKVIFQPSFQGNVRGTFAVRFYGSKCPLGFVSLRIDLQISVGQPVKF